MTDIADSSSLKALAPDVLRGGFLFAATMISLTTERRLSLIEKRAREHGSTIEEEVAAIFEQAVGARRPPTWRLETADRIAAMTAKGVVQDDSTLFICAERDQ